MPQQEWDIDYRPRRGPQRARWEEVVEARPQIKEKWTITRAFMRFMRSKESPFLKLIVAALFGTYCIAIYGTVITGTFVVAWIIQTHITH